MDTEQHTKSATALEKIRKRAARDKDKSDKWKENQKQKLEQRHSTQSVANIQSSSSEPSIDAPMANSAEQNVTPPPPPPPPKPTADQATTPQPQDNWIMVRGQLQPSPPPRKAPTMPEQSKNVVTTDEQKNSQQTTVQPVPPPPPPKPQDNWIMVRGQLQPSPPPPLKTLTQNQDLLNEITSVGQKALKHVTVPEKPKKTNFLDEIKKGNGNFNLKKVDQDKVQEEKNAASPPANSPLAFILGRRRDIANSESSGSDSDYESDEEKEKKKNPKQKLKEQSNGTLDPTVNTQHPLTTQNNTAKQSTNQIKPQLTSVEGNKTFAELIGEGKERLKRTQKQKTSTEQETSTGENTSTQQNNTLRITGVPLNTSLVEKAQRLSRGLVDSGTNSENEWGDEDSRSTQSSSTNKAPPPNNKKNSEVHGR